METQRRETPFLPLLQRSLSWDYLGGGRGNPCCHAETDWRLLPFLVVVCPEEGRYISRIRDEGVLAIRPGEALVVPAGVHHTVGMPDPGVVSYAHVRFALFGSMDVLRFFEVPRRVTGRAGADILHLVRDLHQAMSAKPAGADAIVQAVVRQDLAGRLLRAVVSVSELRNMETKDVFEMMRMESGFNYVEDHLDQPIRRADLADLVFLSETRFHYVFKKVIGVAPMAYVMNARMRKAQILLSQPTLTISQIGQEVGFPNIFHFSKAFKQAFGRSPLHYRRQISESLNAIYTAAGPANDG